MNERASATPPNRQHSTDAILRLLDRPVTPADLEAGAEVAANPIESRSVRAVRLLLFRLGDETIAIPAKLLRRVTPLARPSPIPHRSSGVLRGVCNIRGELVLCADLRRLLGLPARSENPGETDTRRMVVIGPGDNSWVFEVDALMGVENVDSAEFREPPVTVEYSIGEYTQSVMQFGDTLVTILDGDRVLSGFKAGLA